MELNALDTWLERVEEERRSATVLLVAGPGTGKTSVVNEWVRRQRQVGTRVLVGEADEVDSTPLRAFRQALSKADPDMLSAESRRVCLEAFMADGDTPSAITPEAALVAMRADGPANMPTALVIEDIHCADYDTLQLIALLARNSAFRSLIVLTMRPGYPEVTQAFEAFVGRLADSGHALVIEMQPLSRSAVKELAEVTLGKTSDKLVDDLVAFSGGIPFFVRIALDSISSSNGGPSVELDWRTTSPDEVLTGLTTPHSPEAASCGAIAMFSQFNDSDMPLLATIAETSEDSVRTHLDAFVDRRVLMRKGDGYVFAHPLFKHAFAAALPEKVRDRAHLLIADALQSASPAEVTTGQSEEQNTEESSVKLAREGGDLYDIARHLSAANKPLDAIGALTLFSAASRVSGSAPATAATWFKEARESGALEEQVSAMALAWQLLTLVLASRTGEAWALSEQTYLALPKEQRPPEFAEGVAVAALVSGRLDELIEVAEAVPEEQRTPVVSALRAVAYGLKGEPSEALAGYETLFEQARREPESISPLAYGYLMSIPAMFGRRDGAELVRLGVSTGDVASPAEREGVRNCARLFSPHISGMGTLTSEWSTPERDRGHALSAGGSMEFGTAMLSYLSGEWDEVLQFAPADIELMISTGNFLAVSVPAAAVAAIQLERDDLDSAREFISRIPRPVDAFNAAFVAVIESRLDLVQGKRDEAENRLRELIARTRRAGLITCHTMMSEALVRLLVDQGRHREAEHVATAGVEYVRPYAVPLLDVHGRLALSVATGDPDPARSALRGAEHAHLPLVVAQASMDLARMGDMPEPRLRHAYSLLGYFGAYRSKRECEALMVAAGVKVREDDNAILLSSLESAITRQVISGKTNQEIANTLHYSPKTVEVHLSRIYSRTGLSRRVDLVNAVSSGTVLAQS